MNEKNTQDSPPFTILAKIYNFGLEGRVMSTSKQGPNGGGGRPPPHKDQAATAHVAATSATERDVGGRGGRLAAVGGGGDGRGAAADCAEDWASEGQVVVEEEGAPCGVATRRRRGAPAMRGGLLLLGLGREAPRAVGCAAEASDLTHITDFCRTP